MKILNNKYRPILSDNLPDNPAIFNWLIIMLTIAVSLPDYSLASKFMIVLVGYWLFFYYPFHDKIHQLRQRKYLWLSISFLFLLPVFGLIYTDNITVALSDLVLKAPFFVIPLIILSSPDVVDVKQVHKYFSYGVAIVSLSALIQALYLILHFGVDFTFYHEFSFFTHKHTTYFGIFLSLSALYFVNEIFQKRKIFIHSLLLIFILYMLYINGNRMSFAATILGVIILGVSNINLKKAFFLVLSFLVFTALFTQTNFYQNRVKTLITQSGKNNQIHLRKQHWTAVWQSIQHNNLLLGSGTESHRDFLYQKYEDFHYDIAYIEHYNAHNQWLETTLDFGFLGLFLLVLALGFHLYLIIKSRNLYFLALDISIIIFMLTESTLERQSGIMIFSIFISLILQNITRNNTIFEKK